jgi:hypothetical protein
VACSTRVKVGDCAYFFFFGGGEGGRQMPCWEGTWKAQASSDTKLDLMVKWTINTYRPKGRM